MSAPSQKQHELQIIAQLPDIGIKLGAGAFSTAYSSESGNVYLMGYTADDYLKKETYEYFGLLYDVKYFGPMQVLEVKRLEKIEKHPYVNYLDSLEKKYHENYYMVFLDVATDPALPEYLQLWGKWMIESYMYMSIKCTDDVHYSNWLYDQDTKRYYPVDGVIANYRQSMLDSED